MDRLAICICTYNRPQGLATLLASLNAQRLSGLSDGQIAIVAVDNSADGTASEICAGYSRDGRFPLTAAHEERKGLVHARNACLAAAREADATHILFLDDDEAAPPGWLEALYGRLKASGASAAIGPVFPIFERPPPAWLPAHRYVNRVACRDGFADEGYTCNAIIDLSALSGAASQFDPRFNETGGEDTMIFKALRERGHRIAWAEEAHVYEFVPTHRMRRGWLFRRWYRTGNVEARLAQNGARTFAGRLAALMRGGARIGAGGLRVIHALLAYSWREPDRFVASFYTLCRGAGYIGAALGASYKEYSRPAYR
jgi:glycosyltransferase involved in cell wall biosynthesis